MTLPASECHLNQSNLETALRDALKSVLGNDGGSDPRTRFYNKFEEEITEHDKDFDKRGGENLNITLIFSGLLSGIASAFIISIQPKLELDYQEMNSALLELLLNVTVGNLPPGQAVSPSRWTGPSLAIRQVQAILYATLCTALFAAFLMTLEKEWMNQYRRTDARGSVIDRCRERERKIGGVERWWFHIVTQSTPLIQGSLALLFLALSRYLWEVDRMISSVVIGFTSLGFLLYIAMVAVSVLSFDCPFQTPLSLLIRSVVKKVKVRWKIWHITITANPAGLVEGGLAAEAASLHALHRQVFHSPLPLSREKGYRLDARCITRVLRMSTRMDTIRLTMDFVQDVIWDSGINNVPLGWIYRKIISCFDFTLPQSPLLIPALRDIAYLSAKAFTHIQFQQHCIPQRGESGTAGGAWRPDIPHTRLGYPGSRIDPDLGSALLMVDMAFGLKVDIPWDYYRLSPAHHLWVSHLFVYYALHKPLSDEVSVFVTYSLDPDKSPSDAVITDCLYIINIILGTRFRVDDLMRRDKSAQMDAMIHRIFLNLSRRFQSLDPLTNADVSELPFRALNLITRLRNAAVSTRSYELFKTIMESDVGQERKMEAARLALHAAYPPGLESVPPARDPQLILSFLRSHVDPGVGRNDHTISSAMRAIDSASENPASQSWTWRIENAGELLTWFGQSTYPEEFNWWYGVLWLHYGELDPEVRDRMDEIGMSGDDRVDLKQCRVAVEKEIERVKGLDGAKSIVRSLEDAYDRLTALINYREMSRVPFLSLGGLHIVRDYRRP